MADISKIHLGTTDYNIKDASARASISQIQSAIVNTLKFKGITTVTITNEGTQVPTDIYGTKATVADIRVGDLVVYGKAEYVWIEKKSGETSTKQWCLLDALNVYGKLASKDSAAGTTSTVSNHKHTVSVPTYVGTATTFTGNYTPGGTVTLIEAVDGVKTKGTVSAPAVTLVGGDTAKLETATAKGVIGTASALTKATLTPGTFTKGTAEFVKSVTPTPAKANALTNVTATTAAFLKSATVADEVLTITTGNAATGVTTTPGSFMTGVTISTSTNPALIPSETTYTPGSLSTSAGSFSQGAVEFTYATGKVSKNATGATVAIELHKSATATAPTFTATTGLKATLGGATATISVSGTPKLKKSTAETINTSEAGSHNHTVTVQ